MCLLFHVLLLHFCVWFACLKMTICGWRSDIVINDCFGKDSCRVLFEGYSSGIQFYLFIVENKKIFLINLTKFSLLSCFC